MCTRAAAIGLVVAAVVGCKSSEHRARKQHHRRPPVTRPEDVFGGPQAPTPPPPPAPTGWQADWERLRARAKPIGTAECAKCHRELVARAADHHMAHTSRAIVASDRDRWFSEARLASPYQPDTLPHYRRTESGVVVQTVKPPARGPGSLDVAVLIGSATQLTPIALWRDRRIVELGASYYLAKKIWAVTPGHTPGVIGVPQKPNATEHCLFCHTTKPVWADGVLDVSNTVFGIQCERCHGPGSVHAATVMDSDDPAIFQPGDLAPTEQVRFCGQCHGRPSTSYPPFVLDHDAQLARFASVSLMLSDCFRMTPDADRPACLDCHSPHDNIDRRKTARRTHAVCLRCHAKPAAAHETVKVTAASDCVSCHMPKKPGYQRPGVQYTDHWIAVQGRPPPFQDPARRAAFGDYLRRELVRDQPPAGLLGPLSRAAEEWRPRWSRYLPPAQ